MYTWSCTLEVTTPMALAGADQQRAELRPNTFKNMLRWWWRAGHGRLNRPKEARLFGDVETEEASGRASSFRLRLYPPGNLDARTRLFIQDNYSNLEGLQYLGHYLDAPSSDPRSVIKPGTEFGMKIIFSDWFDKNHRRELWASLWLLVWFGGLGARTRRGFGGLRVVDADSTGKLDLVPGAESSSELHTFLQENLRVAREWLNAPSAEEDVSPPECTAIAPGWTEIFVHEEPEHSAATALNKSGEDLKEFRDGRSEAYEQTKEFLQRGHPPNTVDRASFGLPIEFYHADVRGGETATVTGEKHNRRASPLFVGACPLNDGSFARVYVIMKARLLEEGEGLTVKSNRKQVQTPPPDYSVLNDFRDHLVDSGNVLQVSL